MQEIWQYIFYSDLGSEFNNIAMLVFRILLCFQMLRVHGLRKLGGPGVDAELVPNPFNLPAKLNQSLASFSDVVAPVFVGLGLATRLAVLPIMAVTLTGYFVVHRRDSPAVRDVPYIYSLCYLHIALVGAGTYSVDFYFSRFF